MSDERISGDRIAEMDLPDWRSMYQSLEGRFRTGDFATGLMLVNRIGEAAEAMNHHPDLQLRYGHVNVTLISHDSGGKTQRDIDLARQISQIAADLGVAADPAAVSRVELGLDTWDAEEIRPFWMAVLGMTQGPHDDLVDDEGDIPTIWFQDTEPHAEPRQRFHLDIRVPPEVASQRIAAALAAGGVLVSDVPAPTFTVLADPQGNKVCVCTHVGRSD